MADYDPALLRHARELSGLTIKELAERADIHAVTLTRLEGGLKPSDETWRRLERALRAALDEAEKAIGKVKKQLKAA
jgi:ribosome-binding protein aMBF1 (putative translation factor)